MFRPRLYSVSLSIQAWAPAANSLGWRNHRGLPRVETHHGRFLSSRIPYVIGGDTEINMGITWFNMVQQCHKPPMTGNGLHIPTIYGDLVGGWFMALLYTVHQIHHPFVSDQWGVFKNTGNLHSWMVYFMENPIEVDDLIPIPLWYRNPPKFSTKRLPTKPKPRPETLRPPQSQGRCIRNLKRPRLGAAAFQRLSNCIDEYLRNYHRYSVRWLGKSK